MSKFDEYTAYHQPSGMNSALGRQLILEARQHLGCHYVNGAYGAIPMSDESQDGGGLPNRPGGVVLIADAKRLDPTVQSKLNAIAVKAATMTVKEYCVCAGRYLNAGGSTITPEDGDLKGYLSSLGKDPKSWPNYKTKLTPRRSYGPGENGALVWGEDCTGIRHFDCITYVNYCMSQIQGPTTFSIDQWSGAPESREPLTDEEKKKKKAIMKWVAPVTGRTVYRLPNPSVQPQDGDIAVGLKINPQHIGIVSAKGTVYQAASTSKGVHADDSFDPNKWYFLVRTF
jgi:hypothetical protein